VCSSDLGFIDPGLFTINDGTFVGFSLRSGGGTGAPSNFTDGRRLVFQVAADGWRVTDAGGTRPPLSAPTGTGLRLRFILTGPGPDAYSLLVIDNATGATNTITGTLSPAPPGPINNICLFNYNAGASPSNDVYFNSLRLSGISPP
jgi:hypothetical protein